MSIDPSARRPHLNDAANAALQEFFEPLVETLRRTDTREAALSYARAIAEIDPPANHRKLREAAGVNAEFLEALWNADDGRYLEWEWMTAAAERAAPAETRAHLIGEIALWGVKDGADHVNADTVGAGLDETPRQWPTSPPGRRTWPSQRIPYVANVGASDIAPIIFALRVAERPPDDRPSWADPERRKQAKLDGVPDDVEPRPLARALEGLVDRARTVPCPTAPWVSGIIDERENWWSVRRKLRESEERYALPVRLDADRFTPLEQEPRIPSSPREIFENMPVLSDASWGHTKFLPKQTPTGPVNLASAAVAGEHPLGRPGARRLAEYLVFEGEGLDVERCWVVSGYNEPDRVTRAIERALLARQCEEWERAFEARVRQQHLTARKFGSYRSWLKHTTYAFCVCSFWTWYSERGRA